MLLCAGIALTWANDYENSVCEIVEIETAAAADEVIVAERRVNDSFDEDSQTYDILIYELLESQKTLYLAGLETERGESYLQVLFSELSEREAAWFDGIRQLAKFGPDGAGGADVNQLAVVFHDGDGNARLPGSNVQEILAMADVYARENGLIDISEIRVYVNELWKWSHGYEAEAGEIYYCDECMLENEEAESEGVVEETLADSEMPVELEVIATDSDAELAEIVEIEITSEVENLTNLEAGSGECPGHVDLRIDAVICGLEENENLFMIDPVGTTKAADGIWTGWTEENIDRVFEYLDSDWYQEYDLYGAIGETSAPLTDIQIETYLNHFTAECSDEQKTLIHTALESVGKISYYYGGKPSSSGLEGTQFTAIVEADEQGRMNRGLDCTGWINWVYWTAFGERLPYEGSLGISTLGTGVELEELKPGDIALRTGDDSHAVIYLGKTADGQNLCIHESSYCGTVSVSTMSTDWGFYRRILN